jgi:hypothetical protein
MKAFTVFNKLAPVRKLSYMHPLLFKIFPVLYLYTHNLAEVTASDLVQPLIAALVLCALALVVSFVMIALV